MVIKCLGKSTRSVTNIMKPDIERLMWGEEGVHVKSDKNSTVSRRVLDGAVIAIKGVVPILQDLVKEAENAILGMSLRGRSGPFSGTVEQN